MEWNGFTLGGVLVMLLAAAWLWYRSRALQKQSGLPAGNIIYTDTGTWFPNAQPLYAPDLRLTGKPDYLVEQVDGCIIPVEVKSGPAPVEPYEGHLLQLVAYCLLVEANYGVRPTHGILQYKDKAFAIDYTTELEADLLDLLAEMRESLYENEVDRDHSDWRRCARCGLRSHCYQRLA